MADKSEKKTRTKTTKGDFQEVLEKTLENIQADRDRISTFLDKLSDAVSPAGEEENHDRVVMAAQSYAKIADSLVKNNQLQINVAALLTRAPEEDQGTSTVTAQLGQLPFAQPKTEDQDEN